MTTPNDVKNIVAASGGSIAGKTRLQKSAYFLEVSDAGFGFDFSYHYYGPYSEELSTAAADAHALKLVSLEWETSQNGFRYATFRTDLPEDADEKADRRREILAVLDHYDAVSLEIAATVHFLATDGSGDDPWLETRRRKAGKATDDRVERAKQLLTDLGFAELV